MMRYSHIISQKDFCIFELKEVIEMTLKQLIEEWLYENHSKEIKKRTLLRYEVTLRTYVYPLYADYEIESITPRDVQHWVNLLRGEKSKATGRPLSPSSINSFIGILKQAFAYAEDYEIITSNPMRKIKRIPEKKDNKIQAFTRDEQIRFENYIEKMNNPEYFVYILVLYTGLRLGEVTALTWDDINLRTGIMTISKTKYKTIDKNGGWHYVIDEPKTERSIRQIPLPSFLIEKLRIYKREKVSKYVICHKDGRELTDKIIVWRLSIILKRAHIRWLNFHCLRHTFATRALEYKMDIKTLSELLGHANITTTLNIYTHSLLNHKRQAMRKIKRLI